MAKNVWVKIEKLVWHFSPKVPQCNFFIECRKLAPEQKVLKQLCGPERSRGSKSHFLPKNAFFGQKMTFFPKNHFIQNWSVIKTTLCAHAKKNIFKIKLWDCNFHQILPIYNTTYSQEPGLRLLVQTTQQQQGQLWTSPFTLGSLNMAADGSR